MIRLVIVAVVVVLAAVGVTVAALRELQLIEGNS